MNMKRTMKTTIKTIATIGFIVLCICLFNGIQAQAAEPTQESNLESVIDTNQISDFVVNGESLQFYFNDGNGYYWEPESCATTCLLYTSPSPRDCS